METNQLSSILFALFLGVASAGLIAWHIRAWKRLQSTEIDARELNFRRRQFRRRIQTSAMLGILGVAIFVGQLLMTGMPSRLLLIAYWCGVLALVLWLAILALADVVATSFHYSRERNNSIVEQARLQGELRQAREKAAKVRNGKPK